MNRNHPHVKNVTFEPDKESANVTQDGRDFYVAGWGSFHAPFKVKDFDMSAARRAREWFKKTTAALFNPVFEGDEQ